MTLNCIPDWFQAWMLIPSFVLGLGIGVLSFNTIGPVPTIVIVIILTVVIALFIASHPGAMQYCPSGA